MQFPRYLLALTLLVPLAACDDAQRGTVGSEEADPGMREVPVADDSETVSILRPDIEVPDNEPTSPPPLAALRVTIGFPSGGSALDEAARAELEQLLESPQMARSGPITLRAHTDSLGRDKANIDVSEERGLAVAEWLIDNGVGADRITVVALGEQNPIQPNALPDGSPNPEGRAANRRVEIEVALPADDFSAQQDETEPQTPR